MSRFSLIKRKIIFDLAQVDLGWKYKNKNDKWTYVGENKDKIPKYAKDSAVKTRVRKASITPAHNMEFSGEMASILLQGDHEEIIKHLKPNAIDSSNILKLGTYEIPIVYDPSLESEGLYRGQTKEYREHIIFGEKFFKLPTVSRYNLFAHEFGHKFESELPHETKKALNKPNSIFLEKPRDGEVFGDPIHDRQNVNEAIAESFALYMEVPKELKKKYPKVYDFIHDQLGWRK